MNIKINQQLLKHSASLLHLALRYLWVATAALVICGSTRAQTGMSLSGGGTTPPAWSASGNGTPTTTGRASDASSALTGPVDAGLAYGGKTGLPSPVTGSVPNAINRSLVPMPAEPQGPAEAKGPPPAPYEPTQFEKFVSDSTGRSLPLHGYKLFDRSRFPALVDAPVPANYVLGPGDEIDLKVWGAVDMTVRLPVDRQGQVTIPRVGPVTVAGVRASELDEHLKKQVSRVWANFELSANVGKLRTIQIFVVGQARNPGAYMVSSLSTLVGAIFESGGPAATGSMRKIDLIRSGQRIAGMDLYRFMASGDLSADTRLLPGDVVVFHPAGPRVALTGALDNPGIYELASGQERVEEVLAYSGASTTLITPHKMVVERVDNRQVKGPREVQERALDETGRKSLLKDGDVVTLFKIAPQFSNVVTLRGNVASPLRYAFKPGMRVSDLIPEPDALITSDYYTRKNILVQYESGRGVSAERTLGEVRNMLSEINWDYASIERLNRIDVKTVLIPFQLSKAVRQKDPVHDLLLEAGDIVTVYSVNDLAVPMAKRTQLVKVSGEVNVPGIYPIQAGDTLPDLIRRAGGLSVNAYAYGTVFTRESTRVQQQSNLDQAIRRAEANWGSQASALVQNATDAERAQMAQTQVGAQRMSLERLRSLKASGRIALEMDPNRPELPAIALQDGDAISIPPKPSFISVFGAVLAENSFIHRDGHSVRDYLDRAGPLRDADLDAAMVIRSDGTVMGNTAVRSWMGFGNTSFMNMRIYPGDTVFVPEVLDKRSPYTQFIQGAKDWTQLFYQFGLGAAAVKTLRN